MMQINSFEGFLDNLKAKLKEIAKRSKYSDRPFNSPQAYTCYAWEEAGTPRPNWIRNVVVPNLRRVGLDIILDDDHNLAGNIHDFLNHIGQSPVILVFGSQALSAKR